MEEEVFLDNDSKYFISEDMVNHPEKYLSDNFQNSTVSMTNKSSDKIFYTVTASLPKNFSTYSLQHCSGINYILRKNKCFLPQEDTRMVDHSGLADLLRSEPEEDASR